MCDCTVSPKIMYKRVGANRRPKNTLSFFFADGMIFFGIARCNKKDVCTKAIGYTIALRRAMTVQAALQNCTEGCDCDGVCFYSDKQLAGHAKDTAENLDAIKAHFKKLR